ncbi:unnamed protein product [Trypanosoma congolense IL3000]|uniref:Hexosyltransferase n=1 Tax=Trypanosoma congolense (strain IL3000) TaxID=1068625 RepID=F9WIT4_TRYCI|nr:unnamed protein product [Trypanosoma congolense IL3000]
MLVEKPAVLFRARKSRISVYMLPLMTLLALAMVGYTLYGIGNGDHTPEPAYGKGYEDPPQLDAYLRFIPPDVVSTWKAREFLVVMGIPSVDVDGRQRRRDLQRETCWQYNGVARQRNNFTGELLPLYLLAPHQSNGYEISESLWKEATKSHDVVILPTSDVRPSTRRRIGEGGSWGFQSEVVMSRKTYLWLQFALHMFPNASYIVKGDDDMFMHVPQYLADLRVMPRRGLYMGRMYRASLLWTTDDIVFAAGYCTTLSKDAAQAVVSYKPLAALLSKPYSIWHMMQYSSMSVMHEDIMVGRVLREKVKFEDLITVDMRSCKFHESGRRGIFTTVTQKSVVVHHIREEDYQRLWEWFDDNGRSHVPSQLHWFSETNAIVVC